MEVLLGFVKMKLKSVLGMFSGSVLICVLFVVLASAYRVIQAWQMEWPNFSPVMAMAFACGLYLKGWVRWVTPVAIQLISDWLLSAIWGLRFSLIDSWAMYVSYLLAVWIAIIVAKRNEGYFYRLLGCVGCGGIFYLVTNSAAWWSEPFYAKTFSGWLQALTVGIPGYPPTWMFLRNSLVSDVVFFSLLHVSVVLFELRRGRRALALSSAS